MAKTQIEIIRHWFHYYHIVELMAILMMFFAKNSTKIGNRRNQWQLLLTTFLLISKSKIIVQRICNLKENSADVSNSANKTISWIYKLYCICKSLNHRTVIVKIRKTSLPKLKASSPNEKKCFNVKYLMTMAWIIKMIWLSTWNSNTFMMKTT